MFLLGLDHRWLSVGLNSATNPSHLASQYGRAINEVLKALCVDYSRCEETHCYCRQHRIFTFQYGP